MKKRPFSATDMSEIKNILRFTTVIIFVLGVYIYFFSPIILEIEMLRLPELKHVADNDFREPWQNHIKVFYAQLNQNYSEEKSCHQNIKENKLTYRFHISRINSIDTLFRNRKVRIDPSDAPGVIFFKNIVVRQNGFLPIIFNVENSFKSIRAKNNIDKIEYSSSGLRINANGRDPQLEVIIGREKIHFDYLFILKWILVIFSVSPFIYILLSNIPNKNDFIYVPYFLLFIFVITTYTSSVTQLIHLDEVVHVRAGKYYQDHWVPPPICDPKTRDTYSVSGVSRLDGFEVSYWFAGKFSKLLYLINNNIERFQRFRYFNSLLILILALLSMKFIEFRFLTLPFLITPEVWYLFTYFNSDAFSLFVITLVGYQVMAEKSILNKYLNPNFEQKINLKISIILGFLFSFLFLIKLNYYIFIIFIFLLFAKKLVLKEYTLPIKVLKRAGLLILISTIILGFRLGVDVAQNGIHRNKKRMECRIQLAKPLFNPSTPLEDRYPFLHLKERNVPIQELFSKHHWGWKTFIHSFGVYFNLPRAELWYYKFIMTILLLFCVYIAVSILIPFKVDEVLLLLIIGFCSALLILLSLWNSWTAHFQAQGRYLFPILTMGSFLIFETLKRYDKKIIDLFVLTMFCLSVYSYIFTGLLRLPKL
jgi:hypothetical protein